MIKSTEVNHFNHGAALFEMIDEKHHHSKNNFQKISLLTGKPNSEKNHRFENSPSHSGASRYRQSRPIWTEPLFIFSHFFFILIQFLFFVSGEGLDNQFIHSDGLNI